MEKIKHTDNSRLFIPHTFKHNTNWFPLASYSLRGATVKRTLQLKSNYLPAQQIQPRNHVKKPICAFQGSEQNRMPQLKGLTNSPYLSLITIIPRNSFRFMLYRVPCRRLHGNSSLPIHDSKMMLSCLHSPTQARGYPLSRKKTEMNRFI